MKINFKFKKNNYTLIFDNSFGIKKILCVDCENRELTSTKTYISIMNSFFKTKNDEYVEKMQKRENKIKNLKLKIK